MVEIPKLPKLRYDDFYKFITSFSIILFILSVVGEGFVLLYKDIYTTSSFWYITLFLFAISVTSSTLFFWAMDKWKKRQEIFDKIVDIECSTKAADLQKKMQELVKNMDIRNKREGQINDADLKYVQHKINKLKER